MATHEDFLRQAITLADQARIAGNQPFGALLVLDGKVILTAMNSISVDHDPTSHAETNLVAAAIGQFTSEQIGRSILYTSCEPCAMCAGTMYWGGIRSVVYGLSSEDLKILAGDFFLVPCRELFARAVEKVTVIGPLLVEESRAVHEGFWIKPSG